MSMNSAKGNNWYDECGYTKPSAKEFYERQIVPDSFQGGLYYAKTNCCPYCFQRFKRVDKYSDPKNPLVYIVF